MKYGILAYLLIQTTTYGLNCDKSFTFYEDYGQNSFNVTCEGITKGYEHILENITINNEISLTIIDSILENVTPNIFKNVKNIKILNIFNCSLTFNKELSIFNKLEKLEVLNIRDTSFEIENATLTGLNNLKKLQLMNNSLSTIAQQGFNYLNNLEKLDLINNKIEKVDDLQLCNLRKLKVLDLSRNKISKLSNFFCPTSEQTLGFNINSELTSPILGDITNYYNITSVTNDLIDLDLSHNQIVDLGYALDEMVKLKYLDLGFNKLTNIKLISLKSLVKLQKLHLNNNKLRVFNGNLFSNKSVLNFVDLSFNYLKQFVCSNIVQLRDLDLSFNNLTRVLLNDLPQLQEVDLKFNYLQSDLVFQKVPNLISVNLASNHLNNLGFLKNITNLRNLSLRNNSLNNLPDKVFAGLHELKNLDLSFNNIQNASFFDLNNLEILNLSYNNIESLSYDLLEPLKSLRVLDLASNKLVFIEYDVILSKLPTLNNINIKFNQLTCDNLTKFIQYLKQRHIIYTNSENVALDNLSQNVAGIPCRFAVISNIKQKNSVLYNLGICLIVGFVAILTSIVCYRFYIYMKRRRYRPDEFELVVD
ncbi:unnamed protein product [Ceutorhynchus assimilis]|uniref:Toll-like receptor 3 n=1 Tax=Ceutorhynchus assimilis TaxID=467358 RepID=A0A9N9QBB1_9CUCU|nr:unnamed protein product [Ceutorhynchus assimilis]